MKRYDAILFLDNSDAEINEIVVFKNMRLAFALQTFKREHPGIDSTVLVHNGEKWVYIGNACQIKVVFDYE